MCQTRSDDDTRRLNIADDLARIRADRELSRLGSKQVACPDLIAMWIDHENKIVAKGRQQQEAAQQMGLQRNDCRGYKQRDTVRVTRFKIVRFCLTTGYLPHMLPIPYEEIVLVERMLDGIGHRHDAEALKTYLELIRQEGEGLVQLRIAQLNVRLKAGLFTLDQWPDVPPSQRSNRLNTAEELLDDMETAALAEDKAGFQKNHAAFHQTVLANDEVQSRAALAIEKTVGDYHDQHRLGRAELLGIVESHRWVVDQLRVARDAERINGVRAWLCQQHGRRTRLLSA